jgi:hypothetical protein
MDTWKKLAGICITAPLIVCALMIAYTGPILWVVATVAYPIIALVTSLFLPLTHLIIARFRLRRWAQAVLAVVAGAAGGAGVSVLFGVVFGQPFVENVALGLVTGTAAWLLYAFGPLAPRISPLTTRWSGT